MLTKSALHKFQDKLFNLFIIISWSLIIISALGFSQEAPKFLESLDYVKIKDVQNDHFYMHKSKIEA